MNSSIGLPKDVGNLTGCTQICLFPFPQIDTFDGILENTFLLEGF